MAYTSDLRLKNFLKDIHMLVIKELIDLGFNEFPSLRIFDESHEDAKLFEDGGLTFKDPKTNHKYGSNDCAWTFNATPIVVVEGTFGTERGQFGDGQLNRFSHSLGACVNGFIGITILPFFGESYSRTGKVVEGLDNSIRIKYAKVHKGFIKGAIEASKKHRGDYLVIDAYSSHLLVNLIIEKFKELNKRENNLSEIKESVIELMQNEIDDFNYASRSKGIINKLLNQNGKIISKFSRAYTQNYAALTDSSKRDGHGLLGKCLIESYLSGEEKYFAIFLRMKEEDIKNLAKRKQKEFTFINNSDYINVICFDNLIFKDPDLKERLSNIKRTNLFRYRQNKLLKEVQDGFKNGSITLEDR